MALTVTIAGVSKVLKQNSLRISHTANGRATASFAIISTDGSYVPALDAEVLITEGSTRIFGGLVDRPTLKGLYGAAGKNGLVTNVSCVDFMAYADRRFINETIPAGNLKAWLTVIQSYFTAAGYGISLSGSQVNGPDLPELPYVYKKASDALNAAMTLTADVGQPFVWRIDAFKVFSAYQPSTTAAPFNLVGNTLTNVIGDVAVEQFRSNDYGNTITVVTPTKTEFDRVESFTGDGSTSTFSLQYTVLKHYGHVTVGSGGGETLGLAADGGQWTFDPIANTITRNVGASVAGETYNFQFDGSFTGLGNASDAGEIAAVKIWEKIITLDSVPSDTTANVIAAAELARAKNVNQTVKYRTLATGLEVGQSQTITIPRRDIDLTGVITDINISEYQTATNPTGLMRDVTVVVDNGQTNIGRGWRDTIKKWSTDNSGSAVAATAVTPSTTGAGPSRGPAGPDKAIQFNDGGAAFGGQTYFTFNKTTNSIVVGNLCDITAGDHESCQVFGYDNHIADP